MGRRNGEDFTNLPLWRRELHAYRASRRRPRVTLAQRVARDFSALTRPLCGLEALHALGRVVVQRDEPRAA